MLRDIHMTQYSFPTSSIGFPLDNTLQQGRRGTGGRGSRVLSPQPLLKSQARKISCRISQYIKLWITNQYLLTPQINI